MGTRDNRSATTADTGDGLPQPGMSNSPMSPEALRAAAQADEIPIDNRWTAARTLLFVAGASGSLWGLVALVRYALAR